jgi:hypothetical protein
VLRDKSFAGRRLGVLGRNGDAVAARFGALDRAAQAYDPL